MSEDKALRVAARAIDGFRKKIADLERQLAEAQGKLDAVEAWADEFSLATIRDKRYELDHILKEGE